MTLIRRTTDLTADERKLVAVMQEINFGRIRDLAVRNGQPVFDPPPLIQWDTKFDGDNGPRNESSLRDFALKKRVAKLIHKLRSMKDGTIVNLEIRQGVPFVMTNEGRAA